jgi:hypothetical protein
MDIVLGIVLGAAATAIIGGGILMTQPSGADGDTGGAGGASAKDPSDQTSIKP